VRIVIDTNVLLSALLWRSTPHLLLEQVRISNAELVTSQALLDELAGALKRPKFASILRRTASTPERLLSEIQVLAEIVLAPNLPQPVSRDPDDDAVLACALGAKADLIVSGDADLLVLQAFESIPIVSPAQALQLLNS
jgi:uncharacterized protein